MGYDGGRVFWIRAVVHGVEIVSAVGFRVLLLAAGIPGKSVGFNSQAIFACLRKGRAQEPVMGGIGCAGGQGAKGNCDWGGPGGFGWHATEQSARLRWGNNFAANLVQPRATASDFAQKSRPHGTSRLPGVFGTVSAVSGLVGVVHGAGMGVGLCYVLPDQAHFMARVFRLIIPEPCPPD